MAEEPTNPAPIGEIEHGPSKFEQFLDQNQKKLVIGILVLIAAISTLIVMRGLKEDEDHSAGEALSRAGDSSGGYDLAALRDVMDSFTSSPASGSAAILLAEEQWKDNRRDESIETLTTFLETNPEHQARATALMALGLHLLEQDKIEEASTRLQEVVDAPNGRHVAPFALLTLGDLKKKAGDDDAAKALYEQANTSYPENSPSMIQFVNQRIALLGVEPPVKIAPPPVPEPQPVPSPPIPSPSPGGGGLFPELNNPSPMPGVPAGGIPGIPTSPDAPTPPTPGTPTPPTPSDPATPGDNAPTTTETPAAAPTDPAPEDGTPDDSSPADGTPGEPEPDADPDTADDASTDSTPAGEDTSPDGPGTPPSENNETP